MASDPKAWRVWARDVLRRCAEAENKIRHDFGLSESMGLQPTDFGNGLNEEQLREGVERWALGNLSARRAAMLAGGLTDERSN